MVIRRPFTFADRVTVRPQVQPFKRLEKRTDFFAIFEVYVCRERQPSINYPVACFGPARIHLQFYCPLAHHTSTGMHLGTLFGRRGLSASIETRLTDPVGVGERDVITDGVDLLPAVSNLGLKLPIR